MLPNDKQMAALIKRIQKEANTHIQQTKKVNNKATEEVEEPRSEIFDEMKKRPYTS